MSLIIAAILALATAFYIAYPLLAGTTRWVPRTTPKARRLEELFSQRESTYAAIKELDFEYQIGNLTDQDYRELRERYEQKAISLLRNIDEAQQKDDLDERIERQVQALRKHRLREPAPEKGKAAASCPQCGSPLKQGAKFCSECGAALSLFCPSCGAPREVGDRFCSVCGVKL
jgi:predicted nucleic acid-binding Zn ribbon protein